MPFRTASPDAVSISDPQLRIQDEVFAPSDPVTLWDYLSSFSISSEFRVDDELLVESTGLPNVGVLAATVQIDCVHTGFRQLESRVLQPGSALTVSVHVPAHSVARSIEVRRGLTLAVDLPNSPATVAHRKGSRVFWEERRTKFELEGSGAGFPIEAFSFAAAGYPANAAWKLNFAADDLERPFMGAVRLLINTSHPLSSEMLSGERGLIQSVVFHGILEQLLLTVADSEAETNVAFEEGSVGAVLSDLTQTYLGRNLHDAVARLRSDRSAMLARIQDVTGFLQENSA